MNKENNMTKTQGNIIIGAILLAVVIGIWIYAASSPESWFVQCFLGTDRVAQAMNCH
jgi:hypothetical protein